MSWKEGYLSSFRAFEEIEFAPIERLCSKGGFHFFVTFFSLSAALAPSRFPPPTALEDAMSDSDGGGGGGDGNGDGATSDAPPPPTRARPMTNADFRALLSAPRPDAAATSAAAAKKKIAGKQQQQRRNQQRPSREGEGGSKYRYEKRERERERERE